MAWDSRGHRTRTLHGHGGGIHTLVAAANGAWLAVAYLDGTIELRDPQNGQLLHSLRSADHGEPDHCENLALTLCQKRQSTAQTSDERPAQARAVGG